MYTVVAGRNNVAEEALKSLFEDDGYIQVGGNETVGSGWFAVAFRNGSEGQR
jgi:CRISPR-associated protein Cmr4